MSMDDLAKALKVSYQQVQKYELGRNRIGVGKLFELTSVLRVPITFFFEDMANGAARDSGNGPNMPGEEIYQTNRGETLRLIRAYYRIRDPVIRKRLLSIVKALAKSDQA